MKAFPFEAQELWQGGLGFVEVGVGLTGVAYRSPTNAAGEFIEFWAWQSGRRLSSQTINAATVGVATRLGDSYPSPMTGPNDGAGFKTWAATQLSGTIEYFRHDGKSF
jgi:hypothetical protein